MAEQRKVLMVPLHLDALYLRHDRSVLEPMADFSRLPYRAADHDANPDVAYLSEEILSQPFEDRGFHLRAGIHLHWALPDALHKGTSHGLLFSVELKSDRINALNNNVLPDDLRRAFVENGLRLSTATAASVDSKGKRWIVADQADQRTYTIREASHWEIDDVHEGEPYTIRQIKRLNVYGSQVIFPAVPNRWLITRREGAKATGQWVVESDYLHPPGARSELEAVTYPYIDDSDPRPFRYLGQALPIEKSKLPIKEWKEPEDPASAYLSKLTAVGYGEPNFAAFYPNCHSVFGFYDADIADTPPSQWGSLTYDLVGWYSHSDQDCVRSEAFLDALDGTLTRYGLNHPTPETKETAPRERFNDVRYETLENHYGWQVERKDGEAFPERTVCFARIVVDCENFNFTDPAKKNEENLTVRVAVGNTGTEALSAYLGDRLHGDKWKIEDQLEALHLAPRLDGLHLDIGPKFREVRHEKEFTAVAAGTHWTVAPAGATGEQETESTAPLPPEAAHLLNQLNLEHAECDRCDQDIQSMQRQIFADWYKYMICAYPPGDAIDDYPDMDEVRSFIETNGLEPLEVKRAELQDLRGRCAQTREKLLEELERYNKNRKTNGKKAPLELKPVPAPRYWRPNDPVVLIAGEAAKSTPRHGEDGVLKCCLTSLPDNNIEKHLDILGDSVAEVAKDADTGRHHCCEQPWHPFLLEWQVDVHPVKGADNLDPSRRAYEPDFITSNYQFPPKGVDLKLNDPRSDSFTQAANRYSGRTILTPYAKDQLRVRMEAYLRKRLLPGYYEDNRIPPEERSDDNPGKLFDDVTAWYDRAPEKYKDEVTTVVREAYRELYRGKDDPKYRCMTQSLNGFNEALLMRKQTMQLPIDDPLGFEDNRAFTHRVRDAVQTHTRSAPQPLNDFNPIRSGLLELIALRLVDTFGRVQNLDFDKDGVITTEAMAVGDRSDMVHLRPRLSQPARLNFRWLSADRGFTAHTDEPEMNSHPVSSPICGWVLSNHLDGSLMIYSGEGRPLGSIADTNLWRGAPGEPRIAPWEVPNVHLGRLVRHLLAQDVSAFLDDLEKHLEAIDPEAFAHHEALSLLVGRPLAVVRARLKLEIRDLPAVNQDWNVFRRDMRRRSGAPREHDQFTKVKFPVRLGDFGQLNDGLVAFWREQWQPGGTCEYVDDRPRYSSDHPEIHLTPEDKPLPLTMLLDPRGVVHATSGILPTKAIAIPPEQYADTLRRLAVTFATGPVITPRDKINLPLPDEPGYVWSWVENDDGAWENVDTIGRPNLNAHWGPPQTIMEGWLKLTPNDED